MTEVNCMCFTFFKGWLVFAGPESFFIGIMVGTAATVFAMYYRERRLLKVEQQQWKKIKDQAH